jgi:hypothetical protein
MVTQQDVADKAGMQAKPALLAALDRGRELSEADYREMFPDPFLTAQRLMTADVATTTADTALAEAARIMARNDLKRLPVVDSDRHLTGMLARIDVLRVASSSCARRRVLRGFGVSVSGRRPSARWSCSKCPRVDETPAPRLFDLLDEVGSASWWWTNAVRRWASSPTRIFSPSSTRGARSS